jgi:hypothetical protein
VSPWTNIEKRPGVMTMNDDDQKTIVDAIARNAERARRAAVALMHYGYADEPLGAEDFLADLMHLAQREGVDFREMLRMAEIHFTAEVNDEP